MSTRDKTEALIEESDFISRDLSWMKFNERVLDQARRKNRSIIDRLKFIAITASNLDEFFMIRIGSLYNYLDYSKPRQDYSGLREIPFRDKLFEETHNFAKMQDDCFQNELMPLFDAHGFQIIRDISMLTDAERENADYYFKLTVFPMLTPMMFDSYHTFPILRNQTPVFAVISRVPGEKQNRKISFVQIPQNLPRFYEIERSNGEIIFVPIEQIIRVNLHRLFRNVRILGINLFRITRNSDFTLEESDDLEVDFVEEIKDKLKGRKTGRVVRVEIEPNFSKWAKRLLKSKWEISDDNFFETDSLIDYTGLWHIVKHKGFRHLQPKKRTPILPVALQDGSDENIFQKLKKRDIFLHHPFHSFDDTVISMLEQAAVDPNVLAIKMTIYRLADESRITRALLRAAEKGKHVSVLFELKARFDEEHNIQESNKLQKAGCFVIYGMSNLKTHTKMLLIIRKEADRITRYVHMSTGNYNESTSKLYTDTGILSTNEQYAEDVSEFFNAITGHSYPDRYRQLFTAPDHMRSDLISLVKKEAENAKEGKPSGVVIKVNSLQDKKLIEALYKASKAGVPVKLIVRGICCIRPNRKGLSENIFVKSIVGDYLEHSRFFYFHNDNDPLIYSGSADAMVRSFDRRIESLFLILDKRAKQEAINVLDYNLRDNMNSYIMNEDGTYTKQVPNGDKPFDIHREFYGVNKEVISDASLF